VLYIIEDLVSYTPVSVGEREEWTAIISWAKETERTTARL
jgi:hypothetical protein